MSCNGPDAERIAVARQTGTATRFVLDRQVDQVAAVGELTRMASEHIRGYGPRLRADHLADAAGSLIGAHRYRPTIYWSAPAAGRPHRSRRC